MLKSRLIALSLLMGATYSFGNEAPVPTVISAAMRDGTTIMDVTFKVVDPDDATVKVRALAFVDGVRSFANVIKPVTFVENTEAKLGDALAEELEIRRLHNTYLG